MKTQAPLCGGLGRQQSEDKPAACPASMEFPWHPRLYQQQHVHLLKEGQPVLKPLLQIKTNKSERVKGKNYISWKLEHMLCKAAEGVRLVWPGTERGLETPSTACLLSKAVHSCQV